MDRKLAIIRSGIRVACIASRARMEQSGMPAHAGLTDLLLAVIVAVIVITVLIIVAVSLLKEGGSEGGS